MVLRHSLLALTISAVISGAAAQQNGVVQDTESASYADGFGGMPLAYFDQASIKEARAQAMRAEVQRILAAAGIALRDTTAAIRDDGSASTSDYLVRVVILDISPLRWDLPDHAMGVTFGRQMPPGNVYLFYPSILRQLGIANERRPSLTDEEVGRALGRVVVHELVHAFAPSQKHSSQGITGHSQDRRSLTVSGVVLDDDAAAALARGWRRVLASLQY